MKRKDKGTRQKEEKKNSQDFSEERPFTGQNQQYTASD